MVVVLTRFYVAFVQFVSVVVDRKLLVCITEPWRILRDNLDLLLLHKTFVLALYVIALVLQLFIVNINLRDSVVSGLDFLFCRSELLVNGRQL